MPSADFICEMGVGGVAMADFQEVLSELNELISIKEPKSVIET